MDFTAPERSRMVPTMKHSHPYNKLWSMGHDDMAIPTKYLQFSPEKDLTFPDTDIPVPHRERVLASADRETPTSCSQSSITIPRPHGRKTPELGIVPPPPAPRGTKQHPPDPTKAQPGENSNFTAHVIPGPFGDPSPEDSYKHAPDASSTDMLQPVKVSTEVGVKEDILSLLDPLKTGQWQSDSLPSAGSPLPAPEKPLGTSTPCFTTLQSEYVPAAFPQPLAFSSPRAPFMHSHLNPFVQAMPAELPAAGAPGGPFSPQTGSALLSTTGYYQSHRPHPSALPGSNLFGQVPSASPLNPLLQQARSTSQTRRNFPPTISGPAGHRTLPMAPPSSKPQDSKSKAFPPIPPRPSKISDPVLLPSKPGQPKDPFDDLINKTRQEVAPAPGKVEQLRKRWETFE